MSAEQKGSDFKIGDKIRLSKLGLLKYTGWYNEDAVFIVRYVNSPPSYISVEPVVTETVRWLGVGWKPGGCGGPANLFEKIPPKSKPTVKIGDAIRVRGMLGLTMKVTAVGEETVKAQSPDSLAGGEFTSDEYEKIEEA